MLCDVCKQTSIQPRQDTGNEATKQLNSSVAWCVCVYGGAYGREHGWLTAAAPSSVSQQEWQSLLEILLCGRQNFPQLQTGSREKEMLEAKYSPHVHSVDIFQLGPHFPVNPISIRGLVHWLILRKRIQSLLQSTTEGKQVLEHEPVGSISQSRHNIWPFWINERSLVLDFFQHKVTTKGQVWNRGSLYLVCYYSTNIKGFAVYQAPKYPDKAVHRQKSSSGFLCIYVNLW